MKSNTTLTSSFQSPRMSERKYRDFRDFIYAECGINLSPGKKTMLTSRLMKRLRALGMTSFDQYYDYLCDPRCRSEEITKMIDVVTTNKTEFFREANHFDFLLSQALPTLYQSRPLTARNRLNVWSAGCSTGEEPYTLAMVLAEFFKDNKEGNFSMLATDISTKVLTAAKCAIYPKELVESVSPMLKHKYLMRGKGSQTGLYRVVPELRGRVIFQRINLTGSTFGIRSPMDIIFCRNVIIYFDRQTQIILFKKLYNQLSPGGYLFIGHSESLHGVNDQFVPVATCVYRKPA